MTSNRNDSLELLKRRLYERAQIQRKKHTKLYPKDNKTRSSWDNNQTITPQKRGGMSLTIKLFFSSIIFFVFALIITIFVFLSGGNIISSDNVNILISAPTNIEAGAEVTLQIIIENKNEVPLEFTDLLIRYPEGTRVVDNVEEELKVYRKSLGTIKSNEIITETVQAIFFGQEGSSKKIRVELEYRISESNAIFIVEEEYEMIIGTSPIDLIINTLKEVSSGQDLSLEIIVRSNSTEIIEGLLLQIDYPFGFSFRDSKPQAIFENSVWNIGDLEPGGERTIVINGVLSGQDEEEKAFRIESGAVSTKNNYSVGVIYNSAIVVLKIARPFLGIEFLLDGSSGDEYSKNSNTTLRGQVIWTNNSPVKITNAQIEINIEGEVLDEASIIVRNGFFSSENNTIVWDKSTLPELASIEPGGKGNVAFDFSSLPLFTDDGSIFKSPNIFINITARGERLSELGVSKEIKSTLSKNIKIISDIGFVSRSVYFKGPFTNTGPLPPEVNKKTTYTVILSVVNSSNTLSGTIVSSALPSYVRWTGKVSPSSEDVSYNQRDHSVLWKLGVVRGGTGVTSAPREVAFQIELTPSISHLNQTPKLLLSTEFFANDEFADVGISVKGKSVTTRLTTDPQFNFSQERVVE